MSNSAQKHVIKQLKNNVTWLKKDVSRIPEWAKNQEEIRQNIPFNGAYQNKNFSDIFNILNRIFDMLTDNNEDVVEENPPPLKTGKKKALLVGINKYKIPNADLRGCVNDVKNMKQLLTNRFGFNSDDIRVLTDYRATKEAIIQRLKWLLSNAQKGDELVFHYSGHGSQVRDRNGDELNDHLDEILIPTDHRWDSPLTDDIIGNIFKKLPDGAHLTMICDACHSGSMSRSFAQNMNDKFVPQPYDIYARQEKRNLSTRIIGKSPKKSQKHVLISGCRDNQTSADAYINGTYQGAFTWSLLQAVNENPNATWQQIHKKAVDILKNQNFSQRPVLSGNEDIVSRKIFGGG